MPKNMLKKRGLGFNVTATDRIMEIAIVTVRVMFDGQMSRTKKYAWMAPKRWPKTVERYVAEKEALLVDEIKSQVPWLKPTCSHKIEWIKVHDFFVLDEDREEIL